MEVPSNENLEQTAVSSVDAVNPHSDDVVPDSSNHRDGEQDQRDDDFSGKEVRKVLEVIASTGKFWHDWDKLKTMLSFQLKQILLDAKGIYPHLSKLALALEKNLLVTSTLTISTDPFPQATTVQELDEQENANEKQQLQLDGIENGTEPPVADKDEVMAEADTALRPVQVSREEFDLRISHAISIQAFYDKEEVKLEAELARINEKFAKIRQRRATIAKPLAAAQQEQHLIQEIVSIETKREEYEKQFEKIQFDKFKQVGALSILDSKRTRLRSELAKL